jgi:Fe-S cluster assembly protein SufD
MKTISRPLRVKDLNQERLLSLFQERGEPEWLIELRVKSFNQFLALPWPTVKDERWKRTHLEGLDWDSMELSLSASNLVAGKRDLKESFNEATGSADENTSGRLYTDLSSGQFFDIPSSLKDKNVECLPIDIAIKTHGDIMKKAWGAAVDSAKDNKILSLALSISASGQFILIPKGQLVKIPIHSYVSLGNDKSAKFSLTFVFLEEAADAHLWEELIASGHPEKEFVATYTFILLKENAKLASYNLQQWDSQTTHFQFRNVSQGAFSRYQGVDVYLGGGVSHSETSINLKETGAENKVLGVLFGDGKQNFVNWITQNHSGPRTTSDIQYRGALKGSAHSFFSGMVSITKEGQKSDAFQSAKTLLLSRDAQADAIPNLEILADDVKCSHGAAVGPVDEEQKYYLQTRGVDSSTAEEIIVQGFFEPVIAEVPSPVVQDKLREFIEKKLHAS